MGQRRQDSSSLHTDQISQPIASKDLGAATHGRSRLHYTRVRAYVFGGEGAYWSDVASSNEGIRGPTQQHHTELIRTRLDHRVGGSQPASGAGHCLAVRVRRCTGTL